MTVNHSSLAQDRTSRAWYSDSIDGFVGTTPDVILGRLAANSDFAVLLEQRDAWLMQVRLLQEHLRGLSGWLFMEFSIPRMGRRIDAVLLIGPAVFVVEFKLGDTQFDRSAVDQVWDYALDLKNFHSASHAAPIVPILIATGASSSPIDSLNVDPDGVFRPIPICPSDIRRTLNFPHWEMRISSKLTDSEYSTHSLAR